MQREKRIYTSVTDFEAEIVRLKELGKTRKEISEILLLPDAITVKNALYRYYQKQKHVPGESKKRGRPRTTPITPQRELELKVRKLEMENHVQYGIYLRPYFRILRINAEFMAAGFFF